MTIDQLISSHNDVMSNEPGFSTLSIVLLTASILASILSMVLVRRGKPKFKKFAVTSLTVFTTASIFLALYMGYISQNKEEIWKQKVLYGTYAESLSEENFFVNSYKVDENGKSASVTFLDKNNNEQTITVTQGTVGFEERSYITAKVIPVIEGVTDSIEYHDATLYLSSLELSIQAIKQLNERLSDENE